jgi:hypothetical protein
MKFISNWQDLPSLLLPDSVMSLLKTELILPFDDEYSAMNFWDEVGVTLMYIEPDDVPEDIKATRIGCNSSFNCKPRVRGPSDR